VYQRVVHNLSDGTIGFSKHVDFSILTQTEPEIRTSGLQYGARCGRRFRAMVKNARPVYRNFLSGL